MSSAKFIKELVLINAAVTDFGKVLNPSNNVKHGLSIVKIVGGPNWVGLLQIGEIKAQFRD